MASTCLTSKCPFRNAPSNGDLTAKFPIRMSFPMGSCCTKCPFQWGSGSPSQGSLSRRKSVPPIGISVGSAARSCAQLTHRHKRHTTCAVNDCIYAHNWVFHRHHHGVDWWGWHGHYPSHICQRAFHFLELVHTQRTVGQAWSLCRFLYTLITHWPPVDLLKLPKQFPLLTLYPELGRRPSRHPSQLKST